MAMVMIGRENAKEISRLVSIKVPTGRRAELFTFTSDRPDAHCQYCEELKQLASELSATMNGRLDVHNMEFDDEDASVFLKRFKVTLLPATVITDTQHEVAMKFYGLPVGHEFSALLDDIVDVANNKPSYLNRESAAEAARIREPVHLRVFVTPSCPYCPRAVRTAHQLHLVNPTMIDAEMVESGEFMELAEKYSVMAVPKVIVNDRVEFEGALPDRLFVSKIKEALQQGDGGQ